MKKIYFSILLFVASCSNPYAGFDEIDDGIYFKLTKLGTEISTLKKADFILVSYDFCPDSDCDFSELQRYLLINLAGDHVDRDFWSEFHLGDRFTLLYENETTGFSELFSIPDSISINFPVIVACQPSAFHSFNSFTGDSSVYKTLMNYRENELIDSWISEDGAFYNKNSGVYKQVIKVGEGDSVKNNREVTLSYKAYFYNGMLFDDTDNWEDSFSHVVGIPNQIISGLSLGIADMREGGEAKIIIPSHLAFGESGSSTGLVPPFEPLKFEVKIIDIKIN